MLLSADNYWIAAQRQRALRIYNQALGALFGNLNLVHTAVEEITWCSNLANDLPLGFCVNGQLLVRTRREVGFRTLGAVITLDTRFHLEIENRIRRAWG